jgi:hypothetical protein
MDQSNRKVKLMKKRLSFYGVVGVLLLFGIVGVAHASIIGISLGTGVPPGTLGTWNMAAFSADGRPVDTMVSDVNGPYGALGFDQEVRHDAIGDGWDTWSHGYEGDVYDTGFSVEPASLTLTLPGSVHAFYFYAEPVNWGVFTITAEAQDGTMLSQSVDGYGGAMGYGFYTDALDLITSITVTSADADGFAIGEFGVDRQVMPVPDSGGSMGHIVLGLLGLYGFWMWSRVQKRGIGFAALVG